MLTTIMLLDKLFSPSRIPWWK